MAVRKRRAGLRTLLYDEPINCLGRRQCRFELADDSREPVLRGGVCDGVGPDINKGLVKMYRVYARGLCVDDGGLFDVVSRGESAER
ncbi:hypothetical protein K503DRAFT_775017 [Rhizopogon vinicolor AM-OR11-026]|uniref:Uncharacterized protein n=1 Tax=Rhizopogon vinicolor AM-OR11-026 TaxID=1314800 RepID=A0A1B7MN18_9AGAM|nr:hypothetical protein K503DRAFT_775017 [Rhizopogon vinicolor AM-OR11-026]